MSELLNFMAENPWQSFFFSPFFLMLFFGVTALVFGIASLVLNILAVLVRGWPPVQPVDPSSDEGNKEDTMVRNFKNSFNQAYDTAYRRAYDKATQLKEKEGLKKGE